MSADPIAAFIAAVAAAAIPELDVFAPDALVDATVPNWRWTIRGEEDVKATFAHWFAVPGRFEESRRTDLVDGAVVEFLLVWDEDGVAYAAHQLHHLATRDGRIVRDTVFCGGRWPAELRAEMEAAAVAQAAVV
jgi:hypothetical protein